MSKMFSVCYTTHACIDAKSFLFWFVFYNNRMKRALVTWLQSSRDSWQWLRTCHIPLKRNKRILTSRVPRKKSEYWVYISLCFCYSASA